MKKVNLVLIGLFCLVYFIVLVHAADLTDQIDSKVKQLEGTVDTAGKIISNPTIAREELRKTYLKQAWGQILESKPIIGNIIRGYRVISPYTDPVMEYMLGMAPTLSWYFLLLFVVWFTLVRYYSTSFELFKSISLFDESVSLILSLAFFFILTILQVFQTISIWISDKIVYLFGLFGEWYVQLIALIIFIFILIFLGRFSKQIRLMARYSRMKRVKAQKEKEQEETLKQLKKTVEIVKGQVAPSTASMARARAREESGESEYERSTADEL